MWEGRGLGFGKLFGKEISSGMLIRDPGIIVMLRTNIVRLAT